MKRFALILALALPVVAQDATTATTDTTATIAKPAPVETVAAAPSPATTTIDASKSRVVAVDGPRANRIVHLGDEVSVSVSDYESLRTAAAAYPKPITLWIDGLDSQLEPIGQFAYKPGVADAATLRFRLSRTTENTELWRNILRDPFGEPKEKINLSVGISGEKPLLLAQGVNSQLSLEKTFWSWGSVLWLLVMLLLIFLLFRYASDMLRNGPPIDGKKQAFSLGRSQMAWWFILIIASYITIWLITGDRDTITSSLLVLMGISAGTALGSIAIDAGSDQRAKEERDDLTAEKAKLQTTKSTVEATTTEGQAAQEAIDLRSKEIDQTVATITKPALTTGRWLTDVLTDNSGQVALHRFQVFAWTLVLGLIFLVSVMRDLTMPEFNATLLALMGISSGTYLGFKIPTNS